MSMNGKIIQCLCICGIIIGKASMNLISFFDIGNPRITRGCHALWGLFLSKFVEIIQSLSILICTIDKKRESVYNTSHTADIVLDIWSLQNSRRLFMQCIFVQNMNHDYIFIINKSK